MSQIVRDGHSENLSESFSDPQKLASRRLSCISVSIIAHVALLASLALVPDSVKELLIKDDLSKATSGSTEGDVELVDSVRRDSGSQASSAPEHIEPAPVQPIAAAATESDVVVPAVPVIAKQVKVEAKPQPVKKAAVKPAPVTPAPMVAQPVAKPVPQEEVVQKDVITEENEEAVPVAAVVPEPTPVPEQKPEEKPEEKPVAVVVAPQPEQEPTKEPEQKSQASQTPVTAQESKAEEVTESKDSASSVVPSEAQSESQTANLSAKPQDTGTANNDGEGAAAVVTGPIRDASQLKALPGNPNPVYPARDRLARKEGTSVILGRVAADGRVTNARVERSSGSQAMDTASTEAFKKWRFQSGQQGWVRKPFQFRLVGEAKEVR